MPAAATHDTPPPRVRLRREPDWDHVPQTRRVKGKKLQIRWHLRKFGNVNFETTSQVTIKVEAAQ